VFTPLAEEIIYRACFYTALKKRLKVKCAVLISALIFAIVHLSLSQFIPLLVVGIVLALLFERTKSLLVSIITHGLLNLVSVLLIFLS
jgi:membrane protease YdiL (CAAX protease family)